MSDRDNQIINDISVASYLPKSSIDTANRIVKLEALIFTRRPWAHAEIERTLNTRNTTTFIATGTIVTKESAPTLDTINKKKTDIGYAILRNTGHEAEIFRIATHTGFRRQGIATHILHAVIDHVKTINRQSAFGSKQSNIRQAVEIFLEVNQSNSCAVEFYERREFKRCGIRKHYYPAPDLSSKREHALVYKRIVHPY